MTDIVDAKTRSRMMAAVRGRDTGPELLLRQLLREAGLRGYRLHRKDIPGRPDVAWIGRRVAVFVDGAFWHGHPSAFTQGKSGKFWDDKIAANVQRDRQNDERLRETGWVVVRIWDFEVERDPVECVKRVRGALASPSAPAAADATSAL